MVVRVPDREPGAGRAVRAPACRPACTTRFPATSSRRCGGYATAPLPVCERAAVEQLSLPLFPHMTRAQVDRVCEVLDEAGS